MGPREKGPCGGKGEEAVTEEEFIEVAENAEREVRTRSGRYKLKLAMLAVLGYLVIFLILGALALLLGGTVAVAFFSTSLALLLIKKKLILPVLFAGWVLLKSLWVRFEKPEGYELRRSEFPELFAEIDGLRKHLRSLPIHQVLLTNEMNAAVNQTPRLGVLGWQRNTLILGLELLLTLTPAEARSVLAHEFGHLSRNHSKFAGWIYRVRLTWNRVMEAFQDGNSFGARLMQHFFDWYAPYFSAYSFALARSNEYEADAVAAELTSGHIAARALVNVHVHPPLTDESYWERFFRKADELPEPDHLPFEGLARFLESRSPSRDEVSERFREEMEKETAYTDTHPALRDRLVALDANPDLPEPDGGGNAAQAWLGARYREVLRDFDRMWYEANQEKWRDRYDYVQSSRAALADLEARDPDELADMELWHKAAWTEEFRPERDPLPLYERYRQRAPDDPDADYVIGRILYEREDPACLGPLERAAEKPELTVSAFKMGYFFLMDQGREEEAEPWRQRANERIEYEAAMEEERSFVGEKEELQVPDLTPEAREALREQLAGAKNLRSAWIAQKVLKYEPDREPVYVVGFKPKGFYWSYENVIDRVIGQVASTPVTVFFAVKGGDSRKLAKRVMRIGERIV